ncbi:MAG: RagB/SusD family nutrient uptake outer membrane protein [Salinivirgaceae bacterium]|jgi:hypothetical protein|nr:RagB/SusD family nutrient uptake outer membrane protein [Salinivirgaceae bacterium]
MNKYIVYINLALALIFASCGDEFLDTQNMEEKALDNYYRTPQDYSEALAGTYSCLYVSVHSEPAMAANILSDYMFAGGGANDFSVYDVDRFEDPNEDTYASIWEASYKGVYRSSTIIDRIDQAEFTDEENKNQVLGEAYFMRGYYYMRLAQFFGGVPLVYPGDDPNQPRATLDDTWARIASDFKSAIEILPPTSIDAISTGIDGHANLWVAEAMMARAYLYYTGYKTNTLNESTDVLPLSDGGTVTKSEVTTWLVDMIENSGHELNADPRSNWPYSAYSDSTYYDGTPGWDHDASLYPYAENNNLSWAGEFGGNKESVWAIKYTGASWAWDGSDQFSNKMFFQGIRNIVSEAPFNRAWGWCTVNTKLWDMWPDEDVRKRGSITVIPAWELGLPVSNEAQLEIYADEDNTRSYGFDVSVDHGRDVTPFANKKYSSWAVQAAGEDGSTSLTGFYYNLFGGAEANFMLWNSQDFIVMRFSDCLLMAAELGATNAQTYMDEVRTRAGLSSVPPTLENVKKERTFELCFEGIRWFDLARWGETNAALNAASGVSVIEPDGTIGEYTGVYREETKCLLPIPESQINLSEGVLNQNSGW